MKTVSVDSQVWFEIALFEHWSARPHGMARSTQKLFNETAVGMAYRYFYYHPVLEEFIVPSDISYFFKLAAGTASYLPDELPAGDVLPTHLNRASNIIVLTGASWEYSRYLDRVKALSVSAFAVRVSAVIYDVIAIHHPHFFTEEFGRKVASSLRELFAVCDHFICISHSTKNDVEALVPPGKTTGVFRLGENIHPPHEALPESRDKRFILCVGTIEVRKNHQLLYWVWRKLALRYGERCPKLIIVGRVGWLAGDVAELMARDPLTKPHVQIRSDVEDAELAGLYRDCLFSVYPSHYEGYGLPPSESLSCGKVCVTSNSSSLPEINPFPELMFDPDDFAAALLILEGLIDNPVLISSYEDRIRLNCKMHTWSDSARDLDLAIKGASR